LSDKGCDGSRDGEEKEKEQEQDSDNKRKPRQDRSASQRLVKLLSEHVETNCEDSKGSL